MRRLILLGFFFCSCDIVIDAANEAIEEDQKHSDTGSITEDKQDPTATPTPTNTSLEGIEVFFTTPELIYPDKPEERTLKSFEKRIVEDINNAKKSVSGACFEYNLKSLGEALRGAKKRGVTVRLALDEENMEKEEMASWADSMEKAKVPVAWETTQSFLHSKFLIIDDSIVWMGSWNFTNNDTYRNNNNILRITIPEIVANYSKEFSQMDKSLFGRKKESLTPNMKISYKNAKIENYFSPKDKVLEKILPKIQSAKKSIYFLAFSYTEDQIGQAMIERYNSKVKVAGVFEARNAEGLGSEMKALTEAGIEVLKDANCYTMHHKFIVIDDKIVITGSYNFTKRAEEQNDENLIIIENSEIASLFIEEYNRVYKQAKTSTKCGKSSDSDTKE